MSQNSELHKQRVRLIVARHLLKAWWAALWMLAALLFAPLVMRTLVGLLTAADPVVPSVLICVAAVAVLSWLGGLAINRLLPVPRDRQEWFGTEWAEARVGHHDWLLPDIPHDHNHPAFGPFGWAYVTLAIGLPVALLGGGFSGLFLMLNPGADVEPVLKGATYGAFATLVVGVGLKNRIREYEAKARQLVEPSDETSPQPYDSRRWTG
jgi:hypothetical protein